MQLIFRLIPPVDLSANRLVRSCTAKIYRAMRIAGILFYTILFAAMFFLFCIQTTFLYGEVNKKNQHDKIMPLITDTTFALVYVNFDHFNIDEFFKKNFSDIDKTVKVFGFDSTSEKRITKVFLSLFDKMQTKFKSQLDKFITASNIHDVYFLVQVGELDKLKNTIKLSFAFAVPTAQRNEEDRKNIRSVLDQFCEPADASLGLSWAVDQYGGFDVALVALEWSLQELIPIKNLAAEAVVVPKSEEISPDDELIDGKELAAREKKWISNFFNTKNKTAVELITEAFSEHKKNAPFQVICINTNNSIELFEYIFSNPPLSETDSPLKIKMKQLFDQARILLKNYEKSKWMSTILDPDSMMFDNVVQMRNESDAKLLCESFLEFYYSCSDLSIAQLELVPQRKSKFEPLLAEICKGLYTVNSHVHRGDRVELKQKDCTLHKILCVEYCIVGYVLLIVFDHYF
jgi:hypothetical protein